MLKKFDIVILLCYSLQCSPFRQLMEITMTKYIVSFLIFISASVFAQQKPEPSEKMYTVEISRSVKDITADSGKHQMTWDSPESRDIKVSLVNDKTIFFLSGENYTVFDRSFAYYPGKGDIRHPKSFQHDFDGKVEPGKKWRVSYILPVSPASYCQSNESEMSGSFFVGEKETYSVVISSTLKAIDVYPIYETGQWSHCYSGKIARKFLFSPELNMPVSIESVMYSPRGPVHNSHSIKVKEIKIQ